MSKKQSLYNDVLDVIRVNDKIREIKNKCQSFNFDNIQ